ncbi:unnamed protein product [Larinioides sclopetarius]|uniref:Uncharacterized protein n=1 Tax=Larinioides sclopetarius TaxID=280406 RepID=A0AAV1Z266_9ARAC
MDFCFWKLSSRMLVGIQNGRILRTKKIEIDPHYRMTPMTS